MAQAIPSPTLSNFIGQLLAPITNAVVSRATATELRRDAEEAWGIAYHRYWGAQAMREHLAHAARVAEIQRRDMRTPERVAMAQADLDLIAAIDSLMHVPAPTAAALRMKKKLRDAAGGRDRWEVAITADAARLEMK